MANILVSGANGKLGRKVVELLLEAKAGNIIAGTRDTANVSDLVAKGASARQVDFDAEDLTKSFEGIDRLLIISTDAIMVPGQRLKQHLNAVAAAKAAGVKFIAYTSMPNPTLDSPIFFAPDHLGTENAIKESGLQYTILRDAWYVDSLPMFLGGPLKAGVLMSAAGEGKAAHVSREDCAGVAAAVLQNPLNNQTLDVTGSQALSTKEIASIASEVLGKPLKVVDVTPEQLSDGLKQAGVPDGFIGFFLCNDANTKAGNVDICTDVVAKLTGKPATSLKDFIVANKEAFLA